jgi:hypothetical protein
MDCVLVLLLALALQVVMMQIFALKISVDVELTIPMQTLLRHKDNASTHPTLPIVLNLINALLEVATQALDVWSPMQQNQPLFLQTNFASTTLAFLVDKDGQKLITLLLLVEPQQVFVSSIIVMLPPPLQLARFWMHQTFLILKLWHTLIHLETATLSMDANHQLELHLARLTLVIQPLEHVLLSIIANVAKPLIAMTITDALLILVSIIFVFTLQ